jgi:dolichol kinase
MPALDLLRRPEYLHVVLNHLPIEGTIFGVLALIFSFVLRSRAVQIVALVLLLIAGGSAYPVLRTGQLAYKTIRSQADDAGSDLLDEHMDRAEKSAYGFYVMALLALAGLLFPLRWPKSAGPLAIATLIMALICSGLAVYIATPGGEIRHPEFRENKPPTERKAAPTEHDAMEGPTSHETRSTF